MPRRTDNQLLLFLIKYLFLLLHAAFLGITINYNQGSGVDAFAYFYGST
jgi:hypothetical protein